MSAALNLYLFPVFASVLLAVLLSLRGAHFAAQGQAAQVLCSSQGAMLGVLLGIAGTEIWLGDWGHHPGLVLICGLLFSIAVFRLTTRFRRQGPASAGTSLIALFAFLISFCYLISARFPILESHFSSTFFGDLATLTDPQAFGLGALALAGLSIEALLFRAIQRETLEIAILREERSNRPARWKTGISAFVSVVLLALSVQFVGLLFTLSALFLPTALLAAKGPVGLEKHLSLCAASAGLGTALGFSLSLIDPKLPTVPTISVCIVLFSIVFSLLFRAIQPSISPIEE